MNNENKKFSVIIPVYNSQHSLKELFERIGATFSKMNAAYELIFVNDGSHDDSFLTLQSIKKTSSEDIILIDLSKNFGQQNALMCGLQYCKGEYVITLDDDLQTPPEEIPKLFEKIQEGYDVVYGCYEKKKDRSYKKAGSRLFRRLNNKIFNIDKKIEFTSYMMIKKNIVDEIKMNNTVYPYISGMIFTLTHNIGNVFIKHEARKYGKTNYNLSKLLNISYNLLVNYSSIPLKIVSYFGLVVSILSFIVGMFFFIKQLFLGQAPAGWTSIIVLISFSNSILMLLLFFIGEYLSRILKEISHNGAYTIGRIIK